MKTYNKLNQKDLIKTVNIIKDLSAKFPLMTLEDINYDFLSKEFQITKKHFVSTIVFIDWLHKNGVHLDILDVNSLLVKSAFVNNNEDGGRLTRWQFHIKSKKNEKTLKFEHTYIFYNET